MPVLDATDLQAISDELAGDAGFLAAIAAQIAGTDVTLADGVTHGGSSARLWLGQNGADPALLIENSASTALKITGGGSGTPTVQVTASSGDAVDIDSNGGIGVNISGSTKGLKIDGAGSGDSAVLIVASGGGYGVNIDGSAAALLLDGGIGLQIDASAAGVHIATASPDGGVKIVASGGPGVDISGSTDGMVIAGASGDGLRLSGSDKDIEAREITDLIEDDGGTYRFTENALEEAPSGGAGADTYQAKVGLIDADGASTDRYTCVWHKNGEPVTSGVTSPTIQVFDSAGTDLIAVASMTEIGSSGTFRYNATGAERITSGTAYLAKVQATIDASTRTWFQWIGRDA